LSNSTEDDKRNGEEQKVDDPSGSGSKRTRQQIKADQLKDLVAKIVEHFEHLKKQTGIQKDEGIVEGENNNHVRNKQLRFVFMDENLFAGDNEALSKSKYDNEKIEPSYSDYAHLFESLIALQVKPLKKKENFESDYYQQSHQAKLSLIYEMNHENENVNNNLEDNDKIDKKKKFN